jgi:hypothetical protein
MFAIPTPATTPATTSIRRYFNYRSLEEKKHVEDMYTIFRNTNKPYDRPIHPSKTNRGKRIRGIYD